MPQVSIIIPTYNRASFVTKAIDSVLNQTFKDYEILVIDDGSTDDTRKVLEPYANRIRYVYHENSGVSAARNAGIKEAQGEWVAFLDSDDEWAKDYLSTQVTQIKKYPHAIAHITKAVTILPDGHRSSHFVETNFSGKFRSKPCLIFEKPLRIIVNHVPWFLQSTILRRDILFNTKLFDPELAIAEDLDVISQVAIQGPFTFNNRVLVEIFRREETIENLGTQSRKKGRYHYDSFGKAYTNLLGCRGLTFLERMTVSRALSTNWRALGNTLVMADKRFEARQFYKKSVSRSPSVRSLIKFLATFMPAYVSRRLVRNI